MDEIRVVKSGTRAFAGIVLESRSERTLVNGAIYRAISDTWRNSCTDKTEGEQGNIDVGYVDNLVRCIEIRMCFSVSFREKGMQNTNYKLAFNRQITFGKLRF